MSNCILLTLVSIKLESILRSKLVKLAKTWMKESDLPINSYIQ